MGAGSEAMKTMGPSPPRAVRTTRPLGLQLGPDLHGCIESTSCRSTCARRTCPTDRDTSPLPLAAAAAVCPSGSCAPFPDDYARRRATEAILYPSSIRLNVVPPGPAEWDYGASRNGGYSSVAISHAYQNTRAYQRSTLEEVEDPARVAAAGEDRHPRRDDQRNDRETQQRQHEVVRRREQPLDQRQPAIEVALDVGKRDLEVDRWRSSVEG